MYWRQQEVDNTVYPEQCPCCKKKRWIDYDWETGLGYCMHCGWYPEEISESVKG